MKHKEFLSKLIDHLSKDDSNNQLAIRFAARFHILGFDYVLNKHHRKSKLTPTEVGRNKWSLATVSKQGVSSTVDPNIRMTEFYATEIIDQCLPDYEISLLRVDGDYMASLRILGIADSQITTHECPTRNSAIWSVLLLYLKGLSEKKTKRLFRQLGRNKYLKEKKSRRKVEKKLFKLREEQLRINKLVESKKKDSSKSRKKSKSRK